MSSDLPPGLYIVATPIGNLGDMTPRGRAILAVADWIAVEDSRVTGKLLHLIGIKGRMRRYHDHSDEADRDALIAAAREGVVALVSDAGTPLISDPGYKLVRAARAAGVKVTSAPGPCAAITALTLAGLPTDRFLFAGFLPPKAAARMSAIAALAAVPASLVFYESGPRLGAALAALAEALGARTAAVARELTKLHEEVVEGSLAELAARYAGESPKGEIVIVVGPPVQDTAAADAESIVAALAEALAIMSPARAAGEVARRFGVDRRALYADALRLRGEA